MARPRSSERRRREDVFRDALVVRRGDVELAVSDSGIGWRHVVGLLNRDEWLVLLTALREGPVEVAA